MKFSRKSLRNPVQVLSCPLAAASTFTGDYNITELTEKVGCRSNKTLLAKLSLDSDFHHLTLQEAVNITNVTKDHRILSAWANGLGFQLLPLAAVQLSDDEFSDQELTLTETVGEFCKAMRLSRADGVISRADHVLIKQAAMQAIATIMQLDMEIETMVRSSPDDDLHDD